MIRPLRRILARRLVQRIPSRSKVQEEVGRDAAGVRLEALMEEFVRAARSAGASRLIIAGDSEGPFALTLKSGNFATPDFFADALTKLEEVQAPCMS